MDTSVFDVFDEPCESEEPQTKKVKGNDDGGEVEAIIKIPDEPPVVEIPPEQSIKIDDITVDDDEPMEVKPDTSDDKDGTDAIDIDQLHPKASIHELSTEGGCLHEVVCPNDVDYVPLHDPRDNEGYQSAKKYEFSLDPFQREALLCIENNQSVLVSAHTSAGKTVVAEYAIAMSLRDKQRVIYTTPIKALSNQKYREFFEEFRDVGLITGDVTINPSASCLIMTTEILRLMLFRGSDIMREVGWVIFDEIHYMRDKERGVVWEETIILLPDTVHHVFLSATIPNARQFAEWISHLHHQACHVVYTDYRPVPLQHYIYPSGGDGLHLVVDENGVFREASFMKAMSSLANAGDAARGDGVRKIKPTGGNLDVMNDPIGVCLIFDFLFFPQNNRIVSRSSER